MRLLEGKKCNDSFNEKNVLPGVNVFSFVDKMQLVTVQISKDLG